MLQDLGLRDVQGASQRPAFSYQGPNIQQAANPSLNTLLNFTVHGNRPMVPDRQWLRALFSQSVLVQRAPVI